MHDRSAVPRRSVAILGAPSSIGIRPYDHAAEARHLDRAPGVLRTLGLAKRLQADDLGDVRPPAYRDFARPPGGIRNEREVEAYSHSLADRVAAALRDGRFPLLLGGDCSIVLGSLLGVRRCVPRVGLAYIDAHADFGTPEESITGSAASMCLALAVGRGTSPLTALAGSGPLVRPEDVVLVGRRDAGQTYYGHAALGRSGILDIPGPLLADTSVDTTSAALDRLGTEELDGFWIHVDADVLDPRVMPAVDSPEPGGPGLEDLATLLAPLVHHPRALGLQVTIYDPALDVDATCASRLVDLLETVFATSQYKVKVSATITPDSSGTWTFALQSTGPSRLLLDDEVVVDNLNPERGTSFYGAGSTEVRGTIELEAGVAKRMVVEQHKNTDAGIAGLLVGAQSPVPDDGIARAVAAARDADAAVVVVGTNDEWESEGFDRTEMGLPGEQDELVRAVAAANARTVVVLNTGSPVPMPWVDDVAAVLQVWFGGQEIGDGLADVLTGRAEPAGRLPTTFPRRLEDTPAFEHHPGRDGVTHYAEGLFFGHRHYDRAGIEPLFPFGHGLGWSTVDYGDARFDGDDAIVVDVTNTGARPTNECVQAYVSLPDARNERPVRQLAGFARVALAPGETATVRVPLHRRSRQSWVGGTGWVDEPGPVEVHVGRSSRDLRTVAAL